MSITSDSPFYYIVIGAVVGVFLYRVIKWAWESTRHWRL